VNPITLVGVLLLSVGIGFTGYSDGLRRASRFSGADPGRAIAEDPRAVPTLRRGMVLMALGLAVTAAGSL
jgi:hypothetical protein